MMWGKAMAIGFTVNYSGMKNKHFDYTSYKILRELDYLTFGFICENWSKTTKNGTKAKFRKATTEEVEMKLKELMELVKL